MPINQLEKIIKHRWRGYCFIVKIWCGTDYTNTSLQLPPHTVARLPNTFSRPRCAQSSRRFRRRLPLQRRRRPPFAAGRHRFRISSAIWLPGRAYVLLILLIRGFVFREQGTATLELREPAQRARVLLGENQELLGEEDSRIWPPRTQFRLLFDLVGIAPVPILMTSLIRNETGQGWKSSGHV